LSSATWPPCQTPWCAGVARFRLRHQGRRTSARRPSAGRSRRLHTPSWPSPETRHGCLRAAKDASRTQRLAISAGMARMQAVHYRDSRGREPVSDFIDDVKPVAAQVAVDNQIDRLKHPRAHRPAVALSPFQPARGRAARAALPLRPPTVPGSLSSFARVVHSVAHLREDDPAGPRGWTRRSTQGHRRRLRRVLSNTGSARTAISSRPTRRLG
jgi:hypothetical protein